MNRGMNKPVTYASNIWNRGYANCAGNCIVFASILQKLGVPYCIVAVRSLKECMPKHAIIEVGFPENTDIREVHQRAKELFGRTLRILRRDKKRAGQRHGYSPQSEAVHGSEIHTQQSRQRSRNAKGRRPLALG